MVFQTICIASIAAVALALAGHYLLVGRKAPAPLGPAVIRRYSVWERLVHLGLTVGFLSAATTSFVPAVLGWKLTGYWLLAHVGASPVFVVALAVSALTWAEDCRFRPHDLFWRPFGPTGPAGKFDAAEKAFFWLSLLLGLTTVLSAVGGMFPIFAPEGIDLLLQVHRYSALLLLLAVMVHCYRTTPAKPGAWRALIGGKVSADWAERHHRLWLESLRNKETGK